ncbi:GNAT family N-acetyltransferase, partial [Candidatus Poribacteria bacterium]|nr:GNAT family N-acetyltransferase [Candidatus Poribacteria bacterium]
WTFRKGPGDHPYLWIELMLPSDWNRRFEIVEMSLPNLIDWYWKQKPYQYLYAEMSGAEPRYPTVEIAALPIFLKHPFKTEYRMSMKRDGTLPMPEFLPMPDGFKQERYADAAFDELTALASEVYTRENVDHSLNDAVRSIGPEVNDPEFRDSAILVRNDSGKLVGAVWCNRDCLGELVVLQEYQGKGLGRYLFNESLRFIAEKHPGQDIYVGTCREWKKAVRLYEKYDFVPHKCWLYLSLNKKRSV